MKDIIGPASLGGMVSSSAQDSTGPASSTSTGASTTTNNALLSLMRHECVPQPGTASAAGLAGLHIESPGNLLDELDDSDEEGGTREKRSGRRKIKIEYIEDKNRRHITFSKRKAGIMKKAYELSTLTGTQVLLLVASETGHVYTFATPKLQPLITKQEGKNLIQACLNSPDHSALADYHAQASPSLPVASSMGSGPPGAPPGDLAGDEGQSPSSASFAAAMAGLTGPGAQLCAPGSSSMPSPASAAASAAAAAAAQVFMNQAVGAGPGSSAPGAPSIPPHLLSSIYGVGSAQGALPPYAHQHQHQHQPAYWGANMPAPPASMYHQQMAPAAAIYNQKQYASSSQMLSHPYYVSSSSTALGQQPPSQPLPSSTPKHPDGLDDLDHHH